MGDIDLLRSHLVPPSTQASDGFLEIFADDPRCQVEHEIARRTFPKVDNPWIPYAILAGKSVDEVNRLRDQKNERLVKPFAIGVHFGLERGWTVYYELQPVNPNTLEVGTPRIIGARYNLTGAELDESGLRNLRYIGKHLRR